MECFCFTVELFFILLFVTGSSRAAKDEDWDDVVVTKVGLPVSLACSHVPLTGFVKLNWLWMPHGQDSWSLILSVNQQKEFWGAASKPDMRLTDSKFRSSGDFSLYFKPRSTDGGRYSCLIEKGEEKLRQRITMLAILQVAVSPALPVPRNSTLRLITVLSTSQAVSEVAWFSPEGQPMRSQSLTPEKVICKLPCVDQPDQGNYTCQIRPRGRFSQHLFLFTHTITVDVSKVANFINTTYGTMISVATLSRSQLSLPCASITGDYVVLYWEHPDSLKMEAVFFYDRWRRARPAPTRHHIRLANSSSADSGKFSFLLVPELREGGTYICEVFLNDNVFTQVTRVSVLQVNVRSTPSALALFCQYSQRSQVKRVTWTHQNQSLKLPWSSSAPGHIKTEVPLPLGPNLAGNYTCTMELKNGRLAKAVYTVTLPPTANTSFSSPSVLSPLYALGLLVPLVAVAIGVLLWKRGHHNSHPGIEQSLSHYSGEVENVYENPEDLRQTSAQSSVYMDLKPTGDNDIYKELDRYEECLC
ncbi:hypothetical protein AGOR_G00207060 [Albula goreensis]|uniref:Uncharacterized protein n=1 Tax=Albula goreensis TaxID=1534307 RepID=A0A8T3CR80_9TELE|nr:hypothetical protein AGOR_G00207060 [Albula goreensis]